MDKEDLSNLEIFCPDETCGEPLPSNDGVIRYAKRRMIFTGFQDLDKYRKTFISSSRACYMCPVCGTTRKFKLDKGVIIQTNY